jgi:hypothetical protein
MSSVSDVVSCCHESDQEPANAITSEDERL